MPSTSASSERISPLHWFLPEVGLDVAASAGWSCPRFGQDIHVLLLTGKKVMDARASASGRSRARPQECPASPRHAGARPSANSASPPRREREKYKRPWPTGFTHRPAPCLGPAVGAIRRGPPSECSSAW